MPGEARISRWQFSMLLLGFLIGTSTLLIPVGPAGRDSWLSLAVASVAGMIHAAMALTLALRFAGKLPARYFREACGKIVGTILTAGYIWFCMHLASLIAQNIAQIYLTSVLLLTPQSVIIGAMTFLAMVGTYVGIEPLCRSAELISPMLVTAMLSVTALVFATKDVAKPQYLLPILEKGILPVLKSSVMNFTFPFAEAVVFLSVIPYVNVEASIVGSGVLRVDSQAKHSLSKYYLGAVAFAGGLLCLIQVRNVMVLGTHVDKFVFTSMHAVEMINVGEFIQRLDALILFVWTFASFIKMTVCLFAACVNASELLGVTDYRTLVFPIGATVGLLGQTLYRNVVEMVEFAVFSWPLYALFFEVLIPLGVLIAAIVRKMPREKPTGRQHIV